MGSGSCRRWQSAEREDETRRGEMRHAEGGGRYSGVRRSLLSRFDHSRSSLLSFPFRWADPSSRSHSAAGVTGTATEAAGTTNDMVSSPFVSGRSLESRLGRTRLLSQTRTRRIRSLILILLILILLIVILRLPAR